jgi:hypothetical protein
MEVSVEDPGCACKAGRNAFVEDLRVWTYVAAVCYSLSGQVHASSRFS